MRPLMGIVCQRFRSWSSERQSGISARGDFLPLIDGGYSEHYSPLMEYHEGKGMVLFCQTDVTGRTETGPAAARLAENILQYVSSWKPAPERQAVYVGDPAGETYLRSTGVELRPYDGGSLTAGQALIVGPGGGQKLAASAPAIAAWMKTGGHVRAIGLDQAEVNDFLPNPVAMKDREHISSFFEALPGPFTGISPADVQDRDPRVIALVTSGAVVIGDGVLARGDGSNVVFCQLVPWQFNSVKPENQKRPFRRTSVLLARLMANMGVVGSTPLLSRFSGTAGSEDRRWLDGLYLDQPIDWDDPYRFFGW